MSAAGATVRTRAAPRPEAPAWQVWTGLWIVYLVWGSTYLAIRVMVETLPPLLGAGTRFLLAGAIMLLAMAVRRGAGALRVTRAQLASCALVGLLLPGANAVISVAERQVPSNLAALLVAAVPLWVILLRRGGGETISARSAGAVLVGFAGVALLLMPGGQSGGASLVALLACVGGAFMWACGSFASPRIPLPRDPLVSTGWQMLLGGVACTLAALIAGEGGDVHPASWSARSLLALAYLVIVGSVLAFSAYAWLLQNAPLSKVSTYAYVNPVVAIVLGWLILDETITPVTLVGAAIIVASVALVVRVESGSR